MPGGIRYNLRLLRMRSPFFFNRRPASHKAGKNARTEPEPQLPHAPPLSPLLGAACEALSPLLGAACEVSMAKQPEESWLLQ
jgi:hypothetical protein